jgi:pSer/pThr/pTyr-binding forkhead associated (FHA) protein
MPLCARCGHANPEGSRFCSNCGNPLVPGVAPARQQAGERPAEVTSTLALSAVSVTDTGDLIGGELVEARVSVTEALPGGTALLVVQRGPNAGSRFLLDTEVTSAGRAPDSDIFLDDVTVSRRHAEFTRAAQGYLVRDVGSLNGTYVNRERIEEVLLADGDEVQIGKYRLVFLTGAS